MKKQLIFIHSAGKQDKQNGSIALAGYLERELVTYFELYFPAMPEPENPRYKDWKSEIENVLINIEDKIILIGHSLGASVIVKFIAEARIIPKIEAVFLIAAPYWGWQGWEMEEFTLQQFDNIYLNGIPKVFLYHSKNDVWVPLNHLIKYAQLFPASMVRIQEGNEHEFFNGIPDLIRDLMSLIPEQDLFFKNLN